MAVRKPKAPPRKTKANNRTKSQPIIFGPEICGDLAAAEQREWLVTNGIGGFASGTMAGSATRRYHGLLVASLQPPAARTHLVGALDEIVTVDGKRYELATHRWASGAVAPEGHKFIESFSLEGTVPLWTFQLGSARLQKRICMVQGENTTFVHYTLLNSDSPGALELKVLVNYRDFHSATRAGAAQDEWQMKIDPVEQGVRVVAFNGAAPFYLKSQNATVEVQQTWYRDFFYLRENERGLEDREDLLLAAVFRSRLVRMQDVTIALSTNPNSTLDGNSVLLQTSKRLRELAARALPGVTTTEHAPLGRLQLSFAADQFVASRPLPGQRDGKTIIAGYHWFGDWGRDTMIALPGLVLATGRADVAKQILLAFSHYVDRGMLPNNFPDMGGTPEYNTIDATLWYFEAIRQYFAATNDLATLITLFPVLTEIVEAHVLGTRYNIHVDTDGLLYGGGPGVQLTWMDAKIGDWVVTPRTGKPVEINALWISALESMIVFAQALGKAASDYVQHLAKAKSGFAKFWNPQRNCCFDVLDSPGIGNDATLRPNQIFAVSLASNLLTTDQQKSVVDVCAKELLTPFGLRSLAPGEPGYTGTYSGGPRDRDAAYHQGTAWGWLLGPFALAHYRVYQDRIAALAVLEPLAQCIGRYGLGTLAEIYDGDPPHQPRGCIAQAWTVGEVLRVWHVLTHS